MVSRLALVGGRSFEGNCRRSTDGNHHVDGIGSKGYGQGLAALLLRWIAWLAISTMACVSIGVFSDLEMILDLPLRFAGDGVWLIFPHAWRRAKDKKLRRAF